MLLFHVSVSHTPSFIRIHCSSRSNCVSCAVGLLSRAEALTTASSLQGQPSTQNKSQALCQSDIDDVQQLLIQNTKVLTKLQEVLRRDNRDTAILSNTQQSNGLALVTT